MRAGSEAVIEILGWLVGALLAVWFVITVLANIPSLRGPFRRPLHRFDVANLVPDWALFAKPRTVDMVLLRRDVLRDGTLTSWRELEIAGGRRWFNFVWHPELGARRAFLSLADQAARQATTYQRGTWLRPGQGTPSAIPDMTTVPYLAMLKYVSELSHPSVDATQFMLMSVPGRAISGPFEATQQGTIVLVSEVHLVRPPAPPPDPAPHELRDARIAI